MEREGDRVEASGGAGRRPDRVMPVGRAAAATSRCTAAMWPAPGGARRARPCAGEGEGELGRVAERAEIPNKNLYNFGLG